MSVSSGSSDTAGECIHILAVLIFIVCLLLMVLWQGSRFLHLWRRHRDSDRIGMEDAIKQLYALGAGKYSVSLNDLAEALGVSPREAEASAAKLIRKNWVSKRTDDGLQLTDIGEQKALEIVRAHRILESHLAKTGMRIEDIHEAAHGYEHSTTPQELAKMEVDLEYPKRDPHGDPIPNSRGEVYGEQGVPLTMWPLDRDARIVHVEDQPKALFTQLVAMGLTAGTKLKVIRREQNRVLVHSQHLQHILSPLTAGRIMVVDAPPQSVPLGELSAGEHGIVDEIDESGKTLRRLLDIGVVPGSDIDVIGTAPLGDPIELRVRGALITLRQHEANRIWVRKLERAYL